MEEHEEECDFDALGGKAVGVAGTIAFEESVGPHLAQVIAELVEPVALGGQTKVDQVELPPFRGRFTAWDSSRALR
jgi:hypothetical protein